MIPKANTILGRTIALEVIPTRTYGLNVKHQAIEGYCDKLEALKQTIYKIINTERYRHILYSWNFGIELADLFGAPSSYVYPELKRRITEALTQDERIQSVDAFLFERSKKGAVEVSFTVHSIFGEINAERTVNF